MTAQNVLITGASATNSIGEAIALEFAHKGPMLVGNRNGFRIATINRRDVPRLAELARPTEVVGFQADLTDRKAVEEQVLAMKRGGFAKLHHVVLAAGQCAYYPNPKRPLPAPPESSGWGDHWDTFDRMIAVNLTAPMALMHMLVHHEMLEAGATVTAITSISGRAGGVLAFDAYGAAKAGLATAIQQWARQLGPTLRIRANAVAPGFVTGTEMTANAPDESVQMMLGQTLINKLSTAELVAREVVHLALLAETVTGTVRDVNAGARLFP